MEEKPKLEGKPMEEKPKLEGKPKLEEKPKSEGKSKLEEKPIRRIKKEKKNVPSGIVYIQATFNNTIVTITDKKGNVLAWSSAGKMGFKGARKSTPYAAQIISSDAANKARDTANLRDVDVRVKGPGGGREAAIRSLNAAGLAVKSIRDITPIPHDGCRPRKRRRV